MEQSNKSERKRGMNFSVEECEILLTLAEHEKSVVECKKTDKASSAAKHAIWGKIELEFNELSGKVYRSKKELKMKYENLKKTSKQKFAAQRRSGWETGITSVDEKVMDVIGTDNISGVESELDSDATAIVIVEPNCTILEDSMLTVDSPDEPSTSNDAGDAPFAVQIFNSEVDCAHSTPESLARPRTFAPMPTELQEHLVGKTMMTKGEQSTLKNNGFKKPLARYILKRKDVIKNRPLKKKSTQAQTVLSNKVAQAKLELIELQRDIQKEQHKAFLKEHDLKIEILKLDLENKKNIAKKFRKFIHCLCSD